jgi:alcohol dehydrogenase class IV
MAKVIITKDSRKKCDLIIGVGGVITTDSVKNIVVRVDDNDENPCRATLIVIDKILAGGGEYEKL